MIEMIKKTIINIMVTTSAVLLLVPITSVAYAITRGADVPIWTVFIRGGHPLQVSTHLIYEIFVVNMIIHIGFLFTRKFESAYIVLEYLLDVSYTIIVLVVLGLVFNWHAGIPIWLLAIMGVVIYSFNVLLGIIRFNKEAKELNKLLQERKERNKGTVT